jgi:hypothetical protein
MSNSKEKEDKKRKNGNKRKPYGTYVQYMQKRENRGTNFSAGVNVVTRKEGKISIQKGEGRHRKDFPAKTQALVFFIYRN